ncbi:class I SAM-dependent methyltransferase [Saccharopolyspora shandongensis]|uniref:class I SAM-dependent methyltransferase n=1 Tax=Saccharopolyspora shandongensis TaxID=418495 RepID=UPI0033E56249
MDETWDTIADWYAEVLHRGSAMNEFARDVLLAALPVDLTGVRVLDLGCGEGFITRAVAVRGAAVVGIDPTAGLIVHARAAEDAAPTGARYEVDDGSTLSTVADESVDWVTAGLSLNNIPDLEAAVRSIQRVLVPGGGLLFTIPHPCFEAPHGTWVERTDGTSRRVIGDYLVEGFWRAANPQGVRRAGNQHRMLSRYLTVLIDQGFMLDMVAEPAADQRVVAEQPRRAGFPPFLLVRARCGG